MPEVSPSKWLTMVGWLDTPHLSEKTKAELLESTPPHLRKARSEGIPALGSGVVFPIDESLITCAPFAIPDHWPRIVGLDFGWDHPTGATWHAWDRDADVVYTTRCYRRSQAPVPIHAAALKGSEPWIPIAWPHDGMQHDKGSGVALAEQYRAQGCNMLPEHAQFPEPTDKDATKTSRISVEAGLQEMLTRMETGRWKVFSTCQEWFEEFRLYRRENGVLIKEGEDVISASRAAVMMLRFAITAPTKRADSRKSRPTGPGAWRVL